MFSVGVDDDRRVLLDVGVAGQDHVVGVLQEPQVGAAGLVHDGLAVGVLVVAVTVGEVPGDGEVVHVLVVYDPLAGSVVALEDLGDVGQAGARLDVGLAGVQ